jgi:WD40 repeat protein
MQNIEPFFTYSSSEKISPTNCLRFNSSGSLLATGSDKKVNLFNISDDLINHIVNFDSSINNILSVAFNPSGNILAVGSEDNIRLYNISVKPITNIAIPEGKFENVSSISFDSTGNYLAFTSEYNSIIFWKISYNLSGINIVQIANFQEVGNLFSSIMFQPKTNPPILVASSHSYLERCVF